MQRIGPKIQTSVTDEDYERLQKFAENHNCSISEASRRMCHLGLEVWGDYKTLGIPQFAEFVKRAKKAIRESYQLKII